MMIQEVVLGVPSQQVTAINLAQMLLIQQKRQRLKRANGFEIIEVITGGSDQS